MEVYRPPQAALRASAPWAERADEPVVTHHSAPIVWGWELHTPYTFICPHRRFSFEEIVSLWCIPPRNLGMTLLQTHIWQGGNVLGRAISIRTPLYQRAAPTNRKSSFWLRKNTTLGERKSDSPVNVARRLWRTFFAVSFTGALAFYANGCEALSRLQVSGFSREAS